MMRQQLVYDPFTYSDGALATVSGGLWTDCSGFAAIQVASVGVSSYAVGPGTNAAAVLTTWAGSATDQYAQHNYHGAEGGLTLRSDNADNFIFVSFQPGGGVYIFEVIGGTLNQLGATLPLATEMVYPDRLYAEIQGTTILAKQNEIILGTREATGAIGAGKPGFFLVGSAACDDWEAGDFQAPSPLLDVGLV